MYRCEDCSKPKSCLESGSCGVEGGGQAGAGLPRDHLIIQVDGRTGLLFPAHLVSPTRLLFHQESQHPSPLQARLLAHKGAQFGKQHCKEVRVQQVHKGR